MIRSNTLRILRICLLLLGLLSAVTGQAQQQQALSSRRCRWVPLPSGRDTASFALTDTLTIVPTSVSVQGRSVAYDARTGRYQLVRPPQPAAPPDSAGAPAPRPDSVLVCYRVLPLQLTAPRFRRPRTLMDSLDFGRRTFGYQDFAVKEQILSTPGISKTGNLSRGVSFGNTQNVFVNSSLNLQLDGKLTDDITLTAAISDQNVPFQPEGNTQQLQEFDRIYITLTHPRWNLTAGDVVLRNRPDYFLRFYKNVQGAAIETNLGKKPGRRSNTTVAAGVAKGKFASIDIAPIENVQGPYRLRGPNGEQFIIVLANSERVYLDGRLMTRGFDFDYVIDYNQAEVTFSPQHLITRNSRIKVDFEYSDFNYARSLYHLSHYQELGKLSVHANYYREADNPDNSPNLTLDDSTRALLRRVVENVSQVSVPGANAESYDRRKLQYNQAEVRDPVTQQLVSVFTYPPDSTRQVYTVRFTDKGPGGGSYNLSTRYGNANGRVYEYVGPGRGRYLDERLLPTPLEKQMVSMGASYRLDSTTTVFADIASTELDLNRFSPNTDKGQSLRVGYAVQDRVLQLPVLKAYKFRSALDYEYTSHQFAPIDRYRDIEFDRNWSTTSTVQGNGTRRVAREDNILNFSVGAVKDANNLLGYRVTRRYRAGEANGVQHWLDVAQKIGAVEMRAGLFLLGSDAGRFRSQWARGEATARYARGPLVPGYAYRFDKNRVALPNGDSLSSANYFDEHNVFVQSQDSAKARYRLDYTYRRDQTPLLNELRTRGQAQTWQGTFASRIGKNQDLAVLATYRDLAARDSARQGTVLGKIDWNATFLQNVLRSELSYSVATGRELRRDFSFLPVDPGRGTHYYQDTDGDGIQEKDEFFEAQTPDAQYRTYIKVFLPTDDYIVAFTNRFSYRLTLSAPRQWRDQPGWRSLLARFSTISSVTLDRRTIDQELSSRLNPFAFQTADTLLLSLNKLLRNTVYFNRSNPIFGVEFTVQQTQQKVLLSQGFDVRNLAGQSVLLRRTLAQSFTGRLTTARNIRESISDYSDTRNFRLLIYEVTPEISYQPNSTLRFTGTYQHLNKRNTAGVEKDIRGVFDELGLETRISQVSKRTVTGTARYVRVGFDADQSSLVALEILNALRPGSNYTWNLNVEQRLSNGLNVTLAYDGRKPNGLAPIHTGRMQVSVLF